MRPLTKMLPLFVSVFFGGYAVAQTATRPPHVEASVLADTSAIVPGQPFTVAIVFKIDPTWHLYYKNPGDSGMPPSIIWTLPDGFTAGGLQFPKPEILKAPAGTNFVYTNEVALLVTVTPAKTLAIGRQIELSAKLKWLECDDDVCLPRKGSISLKLNVEATASPIEVERFQTWRAKVKEAESFDPTTAK